MSWEVTQCHDCPYETLQGLFLPLPSRLAAQAAWVLEKEEGDAEQTPRAPAMDRLKQ